jgi:hypothetical protein
LGIFDSVKERMLGGQPSNSDEQTEDEKKLASFVKNKIEQVRGGANRVAQEGIWMTNIAYLLGFSSVYYDVGSRQYRPVGRAPRNRRTSLTSNKILPAVQNRLARLTKRPPRYEIAPNTNEEDDKEAARLGLEVLNMIWNKEEINLKRIPLLMWAQQAGHGYLHACWDDEKGERLIDPEQGTFLGYEGDIRADVVSPFEMFVDPLATTLDDATWLVRAKVRKLSYFQDKYERGNLVKEEGPWLLSTQYELRINSMNSSGPAMGTGTTMQMENAAIELSYYERCSKKHPNGRLVIVANGVLLHDDDLPIDEFPYAKFDDVVVAGKFYPESTITHARPLQDQYNKTLSRRAEWTNRLLAGKYIASKNHGLIKEAMNDQSGEVVEYNPDPQAPEPKYLQVPVIPQYAYSETDNLDKEINQIFGLSDVSRGELPSASIPAVGMQLLLEQDETRIGVETEQHEHAFARFGRICLKLTGKYAKTPRKLKTKKKAMEYEVRDFTGDDLRQNFDVSVVRGSTVPTSKGLRNQDVMNAFSQGLLGAPTDPLVREKVLGMMEFGDTSELYAEYAVDMAQIQKTIKEMEQGLIPECDEKDNHAMHIQIKNRYRKSDKWDGLMPEIQALFQHDMELHLQMASDLANPQLASQQPIPVPDMPPPPPGAAPMDENAPPDPAMQPDMNQPPPQGAM